MFRSNRVVGRLTALCAVALIAASLSAQATAPVAPKGYSPSRVDVFLGYSYFGPHGSVVPPSNVTLPVAPVRYSAINAGAIGSVAYYFNRYLGLQAEIAAHPNGGNDRLFTAMGGPIVRLPVEASHFTLFAHGLGGITKLSGPNTGPLVNGNEAYSYGPGFVFGGGMDYDIPFWNHRLGLRLFQADYEWQHHSFNQNLTGGNLDIGGYTNLSAARLSTGLLIHFGTIVPPPPVTLACVATPASLYPGDPLTVTGTASNLNPKKTATYVWTGDGLKVTGNNNVATVDTSTLAAGTYTVKGHVSEGNKPGQMADCAAPFTVMAIQPPTLSCSANPTSVNPGDSSTITATGVSPQNRPLTYSYSTSAGAISGSTSTATLSTTGAAPGTVVVTCNVVDDKGNTATANTQVTVVAPPPPPAPATSSLCSISFERDKARPTRVDNEAKACLDDIALNLQRTSDAKVALVGSSDAKEHHGEKLAAERAVNTKSYLVTEKGIDASRVTVYTGGTDGKTVSTTLVPAGAMFSATGDTPVDEASVKAVPRTPKHKK
jgi:outer membrane protein OmpA-like peptidoglycan-associated protein